MGSGRVCEGVPAMVGSIAQGSERDQGSLRIQHQQVKQHRNRGPTEEHFDENKNTGENKTGRDGGSDVGGDTELSKRDHRPARHGVTLCDVRP